MEKLLQYTFTNFYLIVVFVQSLSCVSSWPHELQHARLPCPSLSPRVCSNSCPLSRWCHHTTSSSVTLFSCPQSFPASGSFPISRLFASGGRSTGASASASILPINIQGWFLLGLTSFISLHSKGLSRVFSSTTIISLQITLSNKNSMLFSLCLTSVPETAWLDDVITWHNEYVSLYILVF